MNVEMLASRLSSYKGLFKDYTPLALSCDEFFTHQKQKRPDFLKALRFFDQVPLPKFISLQQQAQDLFKQRGVTFNVYSDTSGQEKIFPFDLIPRIIDQQEWQRTEAGLKQRVQALNLFLADIYNQQNIIKDGVVPEQTVCSSIGFLPKLKGITPAGGIYIHVAGIDLIRENDAFIVLEDNLKVPSGVSYVLENRHMSKRLLPHFFNQIAAKGIDDYPLKLRTYLQSLSPLKQADVHMAVLTPGPHNSAYFEHAYLAYHMGCPLVQGHDLTVDGNYLYLKKHSGRQRLDVLYRRIDDEYLDPQLFNVDSLLGVPGLMRAYQAGNLILANAPGNGVADDKGIYPFVPKIIRYYLNEDPILAQVETFSAIDAKERSYILNHLPSLVIKIVNQSGGYGIVIGTQATKEQLKEIREKIVAHPRNYIAQPLKQLSTCPTFIDGKISPRRVDLRPFVLSAKSNWVLPGGLTRVALVKGSYIVNSSQGGGSKDTIILEGS